jgi:hypothetical protein
LNERAFNAERSAPGGRPARGGRGQPGDRRPGHPDADEAEAPATDAYDDTFDDEGLDLLATYEHRRSGSTG